MTHENFGMWQSQPLFVLTALAFFYVWLSTKDEKLVAENYLKQSGIDYTIVRPGGLKAKPPTGALQISGEDTLNSGEISRDLVADVCVASLADAKAKNKVLGECLLLYEYWNNRFQILPSSAYLVYLSFSFLVVPI